MTDRLAEHQKRLEDLNDTLEREEDEGCRPVTNSKHNPHQHMTNTTGQVFFPPTNNAIISQNSSSSRHVSIGMYVRMWFFTKRSRF